MHRLEGQPEAQGKHGGTEDGRVWAADLKSGRMDRLKSEKGAPISALAITADSPSIPESHKRDAAEYARVCGFRHEFIPTFEFENPDYVKNEADRCYHCKDELFTRLEEVARERGYRHLAGEYHDHGFEEHGEA